MTTTSVVQKTGNLPGDGSTFTFDFSPLVIYSNSDIAVTLTVTATGDETLLTEGTGSSNYSVNVTTFPGTGTITYPADEGTVLTSASTITIKKVLPLLQDIDVKGALDETLERQLDKIVGMIVQQQEEIDRCLKIPISDSTITSTEINSDGLRTASHHVLVDSTGVTFVTSALSSGTAATASDATPAAVNLSAGSAGSGANFSRSDHAHLLPTTVPTLAAENTFTETQIWTKGSDLGDGDIASGLLTIGAGNWFDLAGSEDLTGIVSVGIGTRILLHFDSVRTIVASTADLVLPGGEDIITAVGNILEFYEFATADWRLVPNLGVPIYNLQSVDPSQKITMVDDFLGADLNTDIWIATAGSGGQNTAGVSSAGVGGRTTLVSDDDLDVDTHAAVCSGISGDSLDWRADQGGLIMETRLQIDDVSEAVLFVGFTDVLSSTVELPIYKTTGADTIDSDATDACGIGYDIDGTTDQFFHGGVDSGTDTAATHSGSAPVDNTVVTLRVEVSTAGAVEGFVNGTSIGTATASAVTPTVPLTPIIVIGNRTANLITCTIDYIWVQANR